MRAKLEFELPDDEAAFRDAIDGSKAFGAIRELVNTLRGRTKYGIPERVKTAEDAYDEMYQEILNEINSSGLDLDR